MAERKVRYSERRRLAETGSLGDRVHEDVPRSFRNALWYLIHRPETDGRKDMLRSVQLEAQRHFGWPGTETVGSFVQTAEVDDLLDLIEILVDHCTNRLFKVSWDQQSRSYRTAYVMRNVEEQLSDLCERHRFGYRLENGEAR